MNLYNKRDFRSASIVLLSPNLDKMICGPTTNSINSAWDFLTHRFRIGRELCNMKLCSPYFSLIFFLLATTCCSGHHGEELHEEKENETTNERSLTEDQQETEEPRPKRQLFDVGLCVSPRSSCVALSECRIVSELLDRQCLAAGRLRDMTCGYSNATRQPLVCCPSMDTGISQPGGGGGGSDYGSDGFDDGHDDGGDEEDGGDSDGGSVLLLPSSSVCGMPQLITGTPPRAPMQAGPTRLGAHPWLARIGFRNLNTGATDFVCSGAIISERAILTAAHCLNARGTGFRLAVVRVGEYDTTMDPDCSSALCAFPVRDMIVNRATPHPNYDDNSFRHDIAVITLRNSLNFSINVQPVCVLTRASAALVGRRALAVGWGRLASQVKVQNQQQSLEVPILPPERCQRFYISQFAGAQDQRVCAGGEQGRDICSGFSGAPLLVRAGGVGAYFLIGVRAFGSDQCGAAGAANVYTAVARYTAFIRNNM